MELQLTVKRVSVKAKRILVTSDIHGNLELLERLLAKLRYRPGEDALIIDGDTLEKGPRNLETLRYVMELAKEEQVYVLFGNCDGVEYDSDEGQLHFMNVWKEKSLCWEMAVKAGIRLPENPEDMAWFREQVQAAYPEEHAFLHALPHILETERFYFAHAGLRDEDLEHQEFSYVTHAPLFPKTVRHRFSKLLVVGHYPCNNYHTGAQDNNPYYEPSCNVLSIDGGNIVKDMGQLNGVVLDNETGEWDWVSVNRFPVIPAPHAQQGSAARLMTWPENKVAVVEQGKEFSRCRNLETGVEMAIPNDLLWNWEGHLVTGDITDQLLEVEEGEPLSLVREYSDRLLVMKSGQLGWLIK